MAAASFATDYANASTSGPNGATLLQRVACAMALEATNVLSEGTGVTGHTQRLTYASSVALNPNGAASNVIVTVVTFLGNAGTTSPADTDLSNAIAALWNLFAGVTGI